MTLLVRNSRRRSPLRKRGRASRAPRVGVFGLFGCGNLGNDASFEVILSFLRTHHPDAAVDAMCMGPERVSAQYGIDTVPMQAFRARVERASPFGTIVWKMFGKVIDTFRTVLWIRRHDAVIVPGMGVLETSLPVRAIGFPYALFVLCASGRLFGAKVAFVSVGATVPAQRTTRSMLSTAARLAAYRSYRDAGSREAMRQQGVAGRDDRVFPDLVFALPVPDAGPGDPDAVGVGVMAYYGGTEDRDAATEIYQRYIADMNHFVRWLVDTGHRVRLFGGDERDAVAVDAILTDLRMRRPDLDPERALAGSCTSLHELMAEMAEAGTVIGTRYHNVVAALKLSKPTISIGYSGKHDALMADMGLSEFSRSVRDLDVDDLIARFKELERRAPEVRQDLLKRNIKKMHELDDQFAALSSLLQRG